MVDITEQKEAEERLRQAEERYRVLVEHIPAVVYVEALDGNPEDFYISPQVREVFGYTTEEWTWTAGFWRGPAPSRRPRARDGDRRPHERAGEPYSDGVPVPRGRRQLGLGPRRGGLADRRPRGRGSGRGSCSTSPSARRPRTALREAEEKFRTLVEQNQAIFYTQEIDEATGISSTIYIAPATRTCSATRSRRCYADPGSGGRSAAPRRPGARARRGPREQRRDRRTASRWSTA